MEMQQHAIKCMDVPLLQEMSTDLENVPGIVVRQHCQWPEVAAQAFGVPWGKTNKYTVSAIPDTVAGPVSNWQPTGEEIEALPELMRVEETSSVWHRIALSCLSCLHLRPLQLHFTERGAERLVVERPYRIGGCIGCPLESTLRSSSTGDTSSVLGMTREDCDPYCSKCVAALCGCTYYTRVLEQSGHGSPLAHKYTLKTGFCCQGRVNNCCGASCWNHNLEIDVLDPQGELVGVVRKTYAPTSNWSACLRMFAMYSNYVFEFPKKATAAQRALLLSAIFHVDLALFDSPGCNHGGGGGGGGGD
jgi:hypothetical protein